MTTERDLAAVDILIYTIAVLSRFLVIVNPTGRISIGICKAQMEGRSVSTERPKRNLIGVGFDLKDFEVALDVAWNCRAISSDSNIVGVVDERKLLRGEGDGRQCRPAIARHPM